MKCAGILAGSAMLLAALSGCAQHITDVEWSRPDLPDELPVFTVASSLPFDEYQLPRSERERLQRATAALLVSCVEEYGLTVTIAGDYIPQTTADPGLPIVQQWAGHLGTLTKEQASEYGYAAPPGTPWQNGNGIYLASPANLFPVLPADGIEAARVSGALFGADQAFIPGDGGARTKLSEDQLPRDRAGQAPTGGGCERRIEELIDVPLVELTAVETDVYGLAFGDDRVKAVNERWVACMKRAGHDLARVDEAAASHSGPVTPESIAVAVADVACTQESRWPDTFYAVLSAYQKQAIQHQPELFRSALAAEQNRLDAVDRLAS